MKSYNCCNNDFTLFIQLCCFPDLQHIEQNERVSMGTDGNLYFSNALKNDSRQDYGCFAAFNRIRTIVQKNAMAVVVKRCRFMTKSLWLGNCTVAHLFSILAKMLRVVHLILSHSQRWPNHYGFFKATFDPVMKQGLHCHVVAEGSFCYDSDWWLIVLIV